MVLSCEGRERGLRRLGSVAANLAGTWALRRSARPGPSESVREQGGPAGRPVLRARTSWQTHGHCDVPTRWRRASPRGHLSGQPVRALTCPSAETRRGICGYHTLRVCPPRLMSLPPLRSRTAAWETSQKMSRSGRSKGARWCSCRIEYDLPTNTS